MKECQTMKSIVSKFKKIGRFIVDTRLWKPSHAGVVMTDFFNCEHPSKKSNNDHMIGALEWLKRAQDATGNGGIAGRYHMKTGFTYAYPETSGHILSTLIKTSDYFNDTKYMDWSRDIVNFLLRTQMENGAHQSFEYVEGREQKPAVFNTGQIMLGLIAWYNKTKDQTVLKSLHRSAEWLLSVQNTDGSWYGSWQSDYYGNIKPTNYTRVAWPLALLGKIFSENNYTLAAQKYLDWLLTKANFETGWIDNMGFSKEDHEKRRTLTHTMAYAYRGLFECSLLFDRKDLIDLVQRASRNLIENYNSSGYLSGVYDYNWNGIVNYSCLTGNCQLSVIWLKLFKYYNDEYFLKAAKKAMDQVKGYQKLQSINPGIRGAIAGSKPIWGEYIKYAYPNWAAKFFIDALFLIEQADADENPDKVDYKFYEME